MGGDSANILETGDPAGPQVDTRTDEAARKLADTPHLVEGWDEWNELELAETDPAKPPIDVRT